MPSPIDSLLASVDFRCTKCGAKQRACGCWDKPEPKPDFDAIGKAMVEVCELALKWQKHGRRYEMRLSAAVSKLKSLGF